MARSYKIFTKAPSDSTPAIGPAGTQRSLTPRPLVLATKAETGVGVRVGVAVGVRVGVGVAVVVAVEVGEAVGKAVGG